MAEVEAATNFLSSVDDTGNDELFLDHQQLHGYVSQSNESQTAMSESVHNIGNVAEHEHLPNYISQSVEEEGEENPNALFEGAQNAENVLENVDNENDVQDSEDQPTIDIIINNVVCSYNTRCHLNLRKIAMEGLNVEYRRENSVKFNGH